MTAREITHALARFHKWNPRKHLLIPNLCTHVSHEVDLAIVHTTGFMEAVEIKISVGDFKREFKEKAERHERLVRGCPKYDYTKIGKLVPDYSEPTLHTVKRFWFAVPASIHESVADLVPDHAGLLVVSQLPSSQWMGRVYERWQVVIAKPAPTLKYHRALEPEQVRDLYRLGYLRYWDLRLQGKETAECLTEAI